MYACVQATTVFLAYFLCTAGWHAYNMYAWGLAAKAVAESKAHPCYVLVSVYI